MNPLTYFIQNQSKKSKVGQICPMLWENKETGISMGSFYILHEVYIEKQEAVVIEVPECKLKAKLARNTISEGN